MDIVAALHNYGPPSVISTLLALAIYFILERGKFKLGKAKTEHDQIVEDRQALNQSMLTRLAHAEERLDKCEAKHAECEESRIADGRRMEAKIKTIQQESEECHDRCARLVSLFTGFMDSVNAHGVKFMLETGDVAKMPEAAELLKNSENVAGSANFTGKDRRFIEVPVTVDRRNKKDRS